MIRPAALALVVFLLAIQGLPIDASLARPVVESISRVFVNQTQTITIRGRHFGYNQPYNGDSPYLWMVDIEPQGCCSGYWRAGCPEQYGPCTTTLNIYELDRQHDRDLLVSFFVWNAQTGRGPALPRAW